MSLTIWDKVFQNFEISCMYTGRRWLRKVHFQKEMMISASDLVNNIKLYKSEGNECSWNLENIFLTQLDCVNQTAAWNWNLFCQLDIINFKLEIMFLHFFMQIRSSNVNKKSPNSLFLTQLKTASLKMEIKFFSSFFNILLIRVGDGILGNGRVEKRKHTRMWNPYALVIVNYILGQ